jgi:hypothetical protein
VGKNDYLVRVTILAGAAGLFIWEVCRADGLLVIQRSKKSFPSRLEALLDSAQECAALALETLQSRSSSVGLTVKDVPAPSSVFGCPQRSSNAGAVRTSGRAS